MSLCTVREHDQVVGGQLSSSRGVWADAAGHPLLRLALGSQGPGPAGELKTALLLLPDLEAVDSRGGSGPRLGLGCSGVSCCLRFKAVSKHLAWAQSQSCPQSWGCKRSALMVFSAAFTRPGVWHGLEMMATYHGGVIVYYFLYGGLVYLHVTFHFAPMSLLFLHCLVTCLDL